MRKKRILLLVFGAHLLISFQMVGNRLSEGGIGTKFALQYYKDNAINFAQKTKTLELDIKNLSSDSATLQKALGSLTECRLQYKRIEFFTAYFFASETRLINAPPVYEVEEPTLELVEPMGLQQIEAQLFDEGYLSQKPELILQAELLHNTASQLTTLLHQFECTDAQILESLRIDLIRVITLSISGFDAPELKTGIREATVALKATQDILTPYFNKEDSTSNAALNRILNLTLGYLHRHPDFDTFDRMTFLRSYALPLQTALANAIRSWDLELQTVHTLNYGAENLFAKDAIRFGNRGVPSITDSLKGLLGKTLFSETALSGSGLRSCASCHQPDRFFTDNLTRSAAAHRDSTLKRNTPTLLYASAQHSQFWDGRAENLEAQIVQVLFNPLELNGNVKRISEGVLKSKNYEKLLTDAFPGIAPQEFSVHEIAEALAVYVTTLQPFNSAFDQYIKGDTTTLTDRQINGFNIFMGKAQCGTCHFPPYFNSLLPPHYAVSEVEVLGTPADANFDQPKKDLDGGRYTLYPIRFYEGAFKTPSVRNAAKTAPYMHNGSFETLAQVIDFYNRGGGSGIGLPQPNQTLSGKSLHLTVSEMEDIALFIETLTDTL